MLNSLSLKTKLLIYSPFKVKKTYLNYFRNLFLETLATKYSLINHKKVIIGIKNEKKIRIFSFFLFIILLTNKIKRFKKKKVLFGTIFLSFSSLFFFLKKSLDSSCTKVNVNIKKCWTSR